MTSREMQEIYRAEEEQEALIQTLSKEVDNIKMMSMGIGEELTVQAGMMDDVEASMDEAEENLTYLTRQTNKLIRASGGKFYCQVITSLTIVAVILFLLLLYT
mmetsp:Transcript_8159/g.24436  ORF Transcript_8159/g.24436 Transcript_8159/m.24436 type:complete len:103 (+) Transcript_8159:281-589(+)